MLRIVYVGNFHRLSVGEPEIAKALRFFGCEVVEVDAKIATTESVGRTIKRGADLLLYAKFPVFSLREEIRRFLRDDVKIPKVCWLFDLYWGLKDRHWAVKHDPIFYESDLVLTTDGGHDAEWSQQGIPHVVLRQGCDRDEIYIGQPDFDVQGAEVGFVGTLPSFNTYRHMLIKQLADMYGDRFRLFGLDGNVRHDDLNRLYASLKVVIGDSVYSPRYWSNRLYEMIGKGAFTIFPRVPGIEEEFTPYKHFVPYDYGDWKGLKAKIDHFLTRPAERDAIRQAGMEHARAHHTYHARVARFLDIVRDRGLVP